MSITLAHNIDATQEAIVLSGPLQADPGNLFRLGNECIAFSGYQRRPHPDSRYVIVQRGVIGTTLASHTAGTTLIGLADAKASGSDETPPSPFASSGGGAVDSVNGQTGVVVLDAGDVGADVAGAAATAQAAAIAASDPLGTAAALLPLDEADVTGLVDALATLAAANGTPLAYDEFSRHANGGLSGKVPLVGAAWVTSGAQPPTVSSGLMGSSGSGYAFQTFADPAAYLECVAVFSGTDDGSKPLVLAWVDAGLALADLIHLNLGETGFDLTVRKDAGTFYSILDGNWRAPVACDATTLYKFAIHVRGDAVTVIGPHGETFSTTDVRIPGLAGASVFWQANTTGTNVIELASVRAIGRSPTTLDIANVPSFLDASGLARLGIVAAEDTFWQMTLGVDAVSGLPSIFWGPLKVRTYLTSACSIGGGTIVTHEPLLPGTTIIDFGTNEETVTVAAASSGTGPYTATLTGTLTKNHIAGEFVGGAGGSRPSIAYNPSSTFVNFTGNYILGGFPFYSGTMHDANFAEILGARKTGWSAATGDALRTTFATSTVTLEELAKRVKALLDDLIAHGLIGA